MVVVFITSQIQANYVHRVRKSHSQSNLKQVFIIHCRRAVFITQQSEANHILRVSKLHSQSTQVFIIHCRHAVPPHVTRHGTHFQLPRGDSIHWQQDRALRTACCVYTCRPCMQQAACTHTHTHTLNMLDIYTCRPCCAHARSRLRAYTHTLSLTHSLTHPLTHSP